MGLARSAGAKKSSKILLDGNRIATLLQYIIDLKKRILQLKFSHY